MPPRLPTKYTQSASGERIRRGTFVHGGLRSPAPKYESGGKIPDEEKWPCGGYEKTAAVRPYYTAWVRREFFNQHHWLTPSRYRGIIGIMDNIQHRNYRDTLYYPTTNWWHTLPIDCQDYDTVTATLAAHRWANQGPPPSEKDFTGIPKDPLKFNFDLVIERLQQLPSFRINRLWGSNTKEKVGFWGFSDDGAVCFYEESHESGKYRITVSADFESGLYKVVKELGEQLTQETKQGTVYMAVSTKEGVEFKPMGMGGEELTKENYSDETLAGFDRIRTELEADKPRGRLTVVNGPPGTGKSYFIRGLMKACADTLFVVVQPGYVNEMVSPSGLSTLMSFRSEHEDKKIVVVLEDADDALAPREESDMTTISALLNLGDGILGSVMDVRIVATTNRETQEFDKAIMRPGRLSTHLTIGPLPATKAANRIAALTGEPAVIEGPMTLGEIYQKAYDKGWTPAQVTKVRKVGFGNP